MLPILRIVDYEAVTASWTAAVKQAEGAKTGVAHLLSVCSRVLNDPALGTYDEERYRSLLHVALVSKKISKADKEPFQRELVMLEVNNVGSAATDFEMTAADGSKVKLSEVESPVTVLFLYEPGCREQQAGAFPSLAGASDELSGASRRPEGGGRGLHVGCRAVERTAAISRRSGRAVTTPRASLRARACTICA